jgi:hypothetical protein
MVLATCGRVFLIEEKKNSIEVPAAGIQSKWPEFVPPSNNECPLPPLPKETSDTFASEKIILLTFKVLI